MNENKGVGNGLCTFNNVLTLFDRKYGDHVASVKEVFTRPLPLTCPDRDASSQLLLMYSMLNEGEKSLKIVSEIWKTGRYRKMNIIHSSDFLFSKSHTVLNIIAYAVARGDTKLIRDCSLPSTIPSFNSLISFS